jgi:hypothetical protein
VSACPLPTEPLVKVVYFSGESPGEIPGDLERAVAPESPVRDVAVVNRIAGAGDDLLTCVSRTLWMVSR